MRVVGVTDEGKGRSEGWEQGVGVRGESEPL